MDDETAPPPPIRCVQVDNVEGSGFAYMVGSQNVTKIEAYEESGPYCMIPYIRVWKGEKLEAEFCKHQIVGVYYGEPEPAPAIPDFISVCTCSAGEGAPIGKHADDCNMVPF